MLSQLTLPQANPIYPTDDNLDISISRFKAALPITDENELFALLMIHQNTLIKALKEQNHV